MKLYNIYYEDNTYGDDPIYECTTDNPVKWLKEHNKQRISDGNDVEKMDYFKIEEINVLFYNKEKNND
tara:strand:- start:422 stop:625 length:204 start_codon:yes stop_codon:yes gene_type:complete